MCRKDLCWWFIVLLIKRVHFNVKSHLIFYYRILCSITEPLILQICFGKEDLKVGKLELFSCSYFVWFDSSWPGLSIMRGVPTTVIDIILFTFVEIPNLSVDEKYLTYFISNELMIHSALHFSIQFFICLIYWSWFVQIPWSCCQNGTCSIKIRLVNLITYWILFSTQVACWAIELVIEYLTKCDCLSVLQLSSPFKLVWFLFHWLPWVRLHASAYLSFHFVSFQF